MKTLLLLRHAKAEPGTSNFDDFERALASVGRAAACRIGDWLATHGPQPACALVSSATRTRQTWELVAAALADRPAERYERALYLGSPGDILAQLARAGGTADCVIVVGHNPGIEMLARLLAGPGSDVAALAALARGYPTGALATFALDIATWADAAAGPARLTGFVRAGDLAADGLPAIAPPVAD